MGPVGDRPLVSRPWQPAWRAPTAPRDAGLARRPLGQLVHEPGQFVRERVAPYKYPRVG